MPNLAVRWLQDVREGSEGNRVEYGAKRVRADLIRREYDDQIRSIDIPALEVLDDRLSAYVYSVLICSARLNLVDQGGQVCARARAEQLQVIAIRLEDIADSEAFTGL